MELSLKTRPYMDDEDVALIEKALLFLKKRHLNILEWGCGGSTIYFPQFLAQRGIDCRWVSVEHNKDWFEAVARVTGALPQVEIHLVRFDGRGKELKRTSMREYVEFPLRFGKKFDFILVDGRKRHACLETARKLLKEEGIVILHDAQRKRYHRAFRLYPYRRFLGYRVWMGSLKNPSLGQKVKNSLNYFYYAGPYYIFDRFRRILDPKA
ncbi:class I SAM-dependent methyltransferase [Thermosulfuriphilus ammonigenes]|uniref:Class I SAM-dependent methyltransferase n=1 Tax=Thermosulfuriphilus ammonigenes TaxID=1936021 RepID=A0A6G7PXD6_9BACT|nr:class I SAM-dependent methyltransferase [Thermosulfuriphilus ammonigenes]MBA2849727.1 putative O-methyltransferase YrrM [Thermosulfuriphilus ammonigenes]QIJ72181.1 class I SAM-dependent methyltransferase [Thermosulfuriphilus ammonigenes]